jgi:DNA mismatch repair protein MutS
MASGHETPAMKQYHRFKQQHPDCILFFRMGDFYELFYEDAKVAAKAIGLTLTQRTEGIPMAGVPYHSVEGYLRRMIQQGYRVAICEQMEDPAEAKGVIRREVTRLVTPGTLTDEALLDEATENQLAAVQFIDDDHVALAFAELSTGTFSVATFEAADLPDELARIRPRELLYVETANHQPPPRIKQLADPIGCSPTPRPAWQFRGAEATETLCKQFQVTTLAGFGIGEGDAIIGPAGAVVSYLLETQQAHSGRLAHLLPPKRYEQADHLIVDQASLRSLEIERTFRSGEVGGSLLGTLQDCRTPMGKRLLRTWLCFPLKDIAKITARQDAVASIVDDPIFSGDLAKRLDEVQDVQRISSRIAIGRAGPRDLVALGRSLSDVRKTMELLDRRVSFAGHLKRLNAIAPALDELGQKLREACVEAPPAHLRDGGLIRDGFDSQLDEYRLLQRDSSAFLAKYQQELCDTTGISSLKVGYNKVFGYYIEVTHTHVAKVPPTFTRKQTLRNAERYITPTLKEYEDKVLGASAKAIAREQHLFEELCKATAACLPQLHEFAAVIGELDVLACFARRAVRFRYVRPTISEKNALHIIDGRHPVLDELLADRFVPNDVHLGDGPTLGLITGPNMAGKSTYIRQAALLTLLAHTGSFVPAASATVGLTDRIFTRIGASDELHTGQSTFMVEMTETANICHHATPGSLVVLDEIGRGTSTLDGLALAWAITETLAKRGCRTLFATHYHELTQLADQLEGITNLNVTVREWADQVVFLHRIAPGAADKSYGIHVAQIAGLPKETVTRARELMNQLEVHTTINGSPRNGKKKKDENPQLSLFTEYVEHPAVTRLRESNLDALSPLQAFDLLRQLKTELEAK